MEYWLATKIYNVNNDIKVKVIVIFKGELESAKGLLVYLVIVVILYKIFNCFNFDFIACLLKDLKQSMNG